MTITSVASFDVRLSRRAWEFAKTNAPKIDAHWSVRVREQPKLFDGEVLMLAQWSLSQGHFVGECIKADFKSFLYWREHAAPDPGVVDFFAAAALHSSEGWLILGRSSPGMSNAGTVYPPSGSLDADVAEDIPIDLDRSIIREVFEETGIELRRTELGASIIINAPPQLIVIRPVYLGLPASEIVSGIDAHLRASPEGEIAEVVIVRGRADIQSAMPPFTADYIRYAFQA